MYQDILGAALDLPSYYIRVSGHSGGSSRFTILLYSCIRTFRGQLYIYHPIIYVYQDIPGAALDLRSYYIRVSGKSRALDLPSYYIRVARHFGGSSRFTILLYSCSKTFRGQLYLPSYYIRVARHFGGSSIYHPIIFVYQDILGAALFTILLYSCIRAI